MSEGLADAVMGVSHQRKGNKPPIWVRSCSFSAVILRSFY